MQGLNGTFRLRTEGDGGVFEVTPAEGINQVSFLIRVKNPARLDYERLKGSPHDIILLIYTLQKKTCHSETFPFILLICCLTNSIITSEIKFKVIAEEASGEGEAEVPVTVHITDTNDNFPGKIFHSSSYLELYFMTRT